MKSMAKTPKEVVELPRQTLKLSSTGRLVSGTCVGDSVIVGDGVDGIVGDGVVVGAVVLIGIVG